MPDRLNTLLARRVAQLQYDGLPAPERAFVSTLLDDDQERPDELTMAVLNHRLREREAASDAERRGAERESEFDQRRAFEREGWAAADRRAATARKWDLEREGREDQREQGRWDREDARTKAGWDREDNIQGPARDLQLDAARRALATGETRTPAERERSERAGRLEDQAAGLLSQVDPEGTATALAARAAALRSGKDVAAAPATQPAGGGLRPAERRQLAEQLRAAGDFESADALLSGTDPTQVPGIAAQRQQSREVALKAGARELDKTQAIIFGTGEAWHEPHIGQAGYLTESTDKALERAAALLQARPDLAVYGITPKELADYYHQHVD